MSWINSIRGWVFDRQNKAEEEIFIPDFAHERNRLRPPRKKAHAPAASQVKSKLMPGESLRDFNQRVDVEARLILTEKAKSSKSEKKKLRKRAMEERQTQKKAQRLVEDDERPSAVSHPLWDRAEAPPELKVGERKRFAALGGSEGLQGYAARVHSMKKTA